MVSSRLLCAVGSGVILSFGCNGDTGPVSSIPGAGGSAGQSVPAAGAGSTSAGNGGAGVGGSAGSGAGATGGGGTSGAVAAGGGAGAGAGSGAAAGAGAGAGAGSGSGGGSGAGSGGKGGSGGTGSTGGTAGIGAGGEGTEPPDDEIPEGYEKGIIGVGYGGIRILSRDGGRTWGERVSIAASGGDDDNLIRAVAYGKGRWIATGWNLWTSDDGLEWESHGKLQEGIIDGQVIVEGLAYKDGFFYAAGDGNPSRLYRSADGLEWERFGQIGNTVKHTGLAYRGGLFVSFGDSHTSYQSEDGVDWTEMSVEDATYCEGTWKSLDDCHDAAWFDDGFYLRVEWGGEILRSEDGNDFETVYRDDQDNTLYKSCAVAEGYVAPE